MGKLTIICLGVIQLLNAAFIGLGSSEETGWLRVAWLVEAAIWAIGGIVSISRPKTAYAINLAILLIWATQVVAYQLQEGFSFSSPVQTFKSSYLLSMLIVQAAVTWLHWRARRA